MATLTFTPDTVHVRLSLVEKILGLLRDHSYPLAAVSAVRVEQNGLEAVRGLRAPGLGLPGLRMIGTWRGRGRSLVSVRRREPAVVVELVGQRHDRLVIGSADAARLATELRERL